jgi:hypothetical protein
MNSERIIHRKARRDFASYTMTTTGVVPHEVFRAAAHSVDQAAVEFDRHNIALERLIASYARGDDA